MKPAHSPVAGRRHRDTTPDAHLFPTRPYDLVKEFVVAVAVVGALSVLLALVFSSPDRKAVSLAAWAHAAPNDVVATAAAELAGTSTSAGYGAPYNHNSDGQKLGPLPLQRWGTVRIPIDSANDLVIGPLATVTGDPALTAALHDWRAAQRRTAGQVGQRLRGRAGRGPKRRSGPRQEWRLRPGPRPRGRFLALARADHWKGCSLRGAPSTPGMRRSRCCCSRTARTWKIKPAPTTWVVTSGA
jgi:hypothetical protein